MGVHGLQTYMEQFCPDACYVVDISRMAKEYQSKTNRQPEIVIDAQSCYSLWCKGIDWKVGFELEEIIHRLKTFVESFTKIGIKLVFFFGGATPEKKRKEWLKRRLTNIRELLQIFDLIKQGDNLKNLSHFRLSLLPPNMGWTLSLILKYLLRCTVYLTVDECDEEIIQYVSKNDSFAVFAQDTDFIVSRIDAVVLSAKNFNVNTMTTLMYDRVKLSENLNINVEDLPLFAILAGNDLMPYLSLRGFHLSLCEPSNDRYVLFQVLMPKLGKYIRKLPNVSNEEKFCLIAQDLFNDTSKLELIQTAYSSYLIHSEKSIVEPVDEWSRILKKARYRHKNTIFPSFIWSILRHQLFECPAPFEDLRKLNNRNKNTSEMASATITRSLRRRLYGVLLYQHENDEITVTEWCAENVDSYNEPAIVEPIRPTVYHPGLLQLWSDDIGERVKRCRITLFINAVAPGILDQRSYTLLTEDDMIATLVMYYLYDECECLTQPELHAMIATYVTFPLFNREKLASMSYGELNMRAAQLSILYIKTFGLVINLLAACGFPVPLSENVVRMKFEGKLFQIKYKESVKDKRKFPDLCESSPGILDRFYKIKNLIYERPNRNNRDKRGHRTRLVEKLPRL